jgi:hypothetical protein
MYPLLKITEENKPYLIRRYTDYVVTRMDSIQILEEFKNYFYREKMAYPCETLENEMVRYCPELLEDYLVENVVGKGSELTSLSVKENYHVQSV